MELVIKSNKLCINPECKIKCNYNFEGIKKGLYCFQHKQDGMLNVKDRLCISEGCGKRTSFNFEGTKKGLYCSKHKEVGMINVETKNCMFEGCKLYPSFNFEGTKKILYCASHKLKGMVNVKDNTCIIDICKKQPHYNYNGEKKALYCVSHKLKDMIDVIHKTCLFTNCEKFPSYNFEGQKQRLYCVLHKHDKMIQIGAKRCKSEWCHTIVKNKYDGYCLNCYIHLFPEKTVARNYKTKERTVVEFVLQEFHQYPWMHDKQIQDGCSRRRPDLFMDFGYQILIVEIDENQHTGENYGDCSCENKRMMLLSQDVGHRPIVFIRFNPDDYYDKDTHITSCFGMNSLGVCCVKKTKQKEWTNRLNVLRENIEYWCDHRSEKMIEIIQLFYDA